jgi:hypothetical protein
MRRLLPRLSILARIPKRVLPSNNHQARHGELTATTPSELMMTGGLRPPVLLLTAAKECVSCVDATPNRNQKCSPQLDGWTIQASAPFCRCAAMGRPIPSILRPAHRSCSTVQATRRSVAGGPCRPAHLAWICWPSRPTRLRSRPRYIHWPCRCVRVLAHVLQASSNPPYHPQAACPERQQLDS